MEAVQGDRTIFKVHFSMFPGSVSWKEESLVTLGGQGIKLWTSATSLFMWFPIKWYDFWWPCAHEKAVHEYTIPKAAERLRRSLVNMANFKNCEPGYLSTISKIGKLTVLAIHIKFKSYQQLSLSLVSVVMSYASLFSFFVHISNDKRAVHTPYAWLWTILSKNAEGSEQRVQRVLHKVAIPWAVLIDCLSLNTVLAVQDLPLVAFSPCHIHTTTWFYSSGSSWFNCLNVSRPSFPFRERDSGNEAKLTFPCICTYHQERLATILAVVLLGLDMVQVGEELIPLLV